MSFGEIIILIYVIFQILKIEINKTLINTDIDEKRCRQKKKYTSAGKQGLYGEGDMVYGWPKKVRVGKTQILGRMGLLTPLIISISINSVTFTLLQ